MTESLGTSVQNATAGSPIGLSALEQAQRLRRGALTSEELVSFYLDRIERLDVRYSAFTAVLRERALAEARQKDRQRRDASLPPFHGVPVAVKDLHFLRGAFTRMGSRSYQWLWSPYDDLTVRALRRAGFVIVGKTTTSELALMPIVEPDTHPPTRNPWNPERTSGGSSGGAGAAVAAGMLPLSPGSDGAGSIRIPSALCGLVGHKPSRHLVPNPHAPMDKLGMTAIGPMARTVDDAAALLDVLVGRDPSAPGSFLAQSRERPPRMTIGVITLSPLGATDPEHAAAVEEAASTLSRLGHRLVPLQGALATLDEFLPIYQRLLAGIPVIFESKLQPLTRWFRAEGRRRSEAEAKRQFDLLSARATEAFGSCDLVITPTTPIPPPKVGAFQHLGPEEAFRAAAHLGAFTAAANLTGAPASTLPWCLSSEGLPIGVQVFGALGDDARVLSLTRELETHRTKAPGMPTMR
jgi:amidase